MGSLAVARMRAGNAQPAVGERMLEAAPHRGSRHLVEVSGSAVLAVSADPEVDDASLARGDGLVVAVGGEIDNRDELVAELGRAGRTSGDPADSASVVLAAFEAWGTDAVKRLRGSFSGAIWDGTDMRLFRDQLGFGTLFVADRPDGVYAASEGKQVVAGAGIDREPDLDAVADIFFGRLDERASALKGVGRLPKASTATADDAGLRNPERYWDPTPLIETADLDVRAAQERLAALLDQAVGRAVSGRDAISLSGGLDSPTVAAFAAPRHLAISGRPLTAISTVYPDHPTVDESHYIELVAEQFDLRLETHAHVSRPLDDVARWVDALDGPWDTISIPEAAETYRAARELGVRRVLTGELAEAVATLGGPPLFAHLLTHGRLNASVDWLRRSRARGMRPVAMLRRAVPSLVPASLARRYVRMRQARFRQRELGLVPDWVSPAAIQGLGARPDFALPVRQRWVDSQLGPIFTPLGPSEEADELCAAHFGVELRLPFVDVDVWEFFLSLPAEVKFPDLSNVSKTLIRETMRGRLPDELLDRKRKTYFNEHIGDTADYDGLRRWTLETEFRMPGVDYDRLRRAIEGRTMAVNDVVWGYDLARAHAFAALWE